MFREDAGRLTEFDGKGFAHALLAAHRDLQTIQRRGRRQTRDHGGERDRADPFEHHFQPSLSKRSLRGAHKHRNAAPTPMCCACAVATRA